LRDIKVQLDADPRAKGRLKIAFTDWLFHGQPDRVPQFNNLGGVLCTAGFLNTLIRTADFTPVSDMTGLIEFGGIWKKRGKVYAVPAYWAFRMYSNADAVTPVEPRTAVETYDIHEGNNRLLDGLILLRRQGTRQALGRTRRILATDQMGQLRELFGPSKFFQDAPQVHESGDVDRRLQ
jgi:alpha-L-arabinofuranosidase